MSRIVAFGAGGEPDVVAGVFERHGHGLVGEPPGAGVNVLVVGPVLEKDADGLGLDDADQVGQPVGAAEVGVATHEAEDAAKRVGTFPGGVEGGDTAGRRAGNGAVVRVGGELVLFGHLGQDLFKEEACVAVAEPVVFVRPVEARHLLGAGGGKNTGTDQDRDGHRHGAFLNQVVEDGGQPPCAVFIGEAGAVLKNHHGGGFGAVVLGRDVDPVVAGGAGKDF